MASLGALRLTFPDLQPNPGSLDFMKALKPCEQATPPLLSALNQARADSLTALQAALTSSSFKVFESAQAPTAHYLAILDSLGSKDQSKADAKAILFLFGMAALRTGNQSWNASSPGLIVAGKRQEAFQAFLKAAGIFELHLSLEASPQQALTPTKGLLALALAYGQLIQAAEIEEKEPSLIRRAELLVPLCLEISAQLSSAAAFLPPLFPGREEQRFLQHLEALASLLQARALFHHAGRLTEGSAEEDEAFGQGIKALQVALEHLSASEKASSSGKLGKDTVGPLKAFAAEVERALAKANKENDSVFFNRIPSEVSLPAPQASSVPARLILPQLDPQLLDPEVLISLEFIEEAPMAAAAQGPPPSPKDSEAEAEAEAEAEHEHEHEAEAEAAAITTEATGEKREASDHAQKEKGKRGGEPIPPPPPPFTKEARIVVVGGGPAGLHMAHELKKQGYTNVIVLEREEGVGGKSKTIYHKYGGVVTPFELGTHCLPFTYKHTIALMEEVGAGGITPLNRVEMVCPELQKRRGRNPTQSLSLKSWTLQVAATFSKVPSPIVALPILMAFLRYRRLHRRYFGRYQGFVPPAPAPEHLEALNMDFEAWLREHGLLALTPVLEVTTTMQGYGTLKAVPAYYGLAWNRPPFVWGMLVKRNAAFVVRQGWTHLWETLASKTPAEIRRRCQVTRINRHLPQDPSHPPQPIEITYLDHKVEGGEEVKLEADFLILATPMSHALGWLEDATEEEQTLWSAPSHTGLIASLVDTTTVPKKGEPMMVVAPELLAVDGSYYAHVNTQREIFPKQQIPTDADISVAYQAYSTYDPNRREEAEESLKRDLTRLYSWEDPVILYQHMTEYFPHYSQEQIQQRFPWRAMELQGKHRTWYIGSSVAFEAVEPCLEHNVAMLSEHLGIKPKK